MKRNDSHRRIESRWPSSYYSSKYLKIFNFKTENVLIYLFSIYLISRCLVAVIPENIRISLISGGRNFPQSPLPFEKSKELRGFSTCPPSFSLGRCLWIIQVDQLLRRPSSVPLSTSNQGISSVQEVSML